MTDNPTTPSAEDLARKSLQCLYLEADSSIADDVREKVFAAFAEIRANTRREAMEECRDAACPQCAMEIRAMMEASDGD